MILYIHGFASSGASKKAKILKNYFGNDLVIAPSLSYIPSYAIRELEHIIEDLRSQNIPILLVGSSLGGFYALYLSAKYNLKAVLINPTLNPFEDLKKMVGSNINIQSGKSFELTYEHLMQLRAYETSKFDQKNFLLMLQTGDEVLDYKRAIEMLPYAKKIVVEGGSHEFSHFEDYIEEIRRFYETITL